MSLGAYNYNSMATRPASCVYKSFGCTNDTTAYNYNASDDMLDDGSCKNATSFFASPLSKTLASTPPGAGRVFAPVCCAVRSD